MENTLHITNGDCTGNSLNKAGLSGEVVIWRDMLYDGSRKPGWPNEETLHSRADFLTHSTAGGLDRQQILNTLRTPYNKLSEAEPGRHIVLWFDACLFDQAMLAHILTCLHHRGIMRSVELICINSFPGIAPFHGLGQLQPEQLASLYDTRSPVSDEQFRFAIRTDKAFATQDIALLTELSKTADAPLPWVRAATARWLMEQPDPVSGLGHLETLALASIRKGDKTPTSIFTSVAAADTPPQFWGDTTLWAKINGLADRDPPLVKIEGPANRLPQWESDVSLTDFSITALPPLREN